MECAGVNVAVKSQAGSGVPVVLLHGWGASAAAMDGVYNYLSSRGRTVAALDFPGFGGSDAPGEDWGIENYADCAASVITQLGYDSPVLIGHSFGGRVAIILGSRGLASKLVLTDAAGCKPRFSPAKHRAVARYKRAVRRGRDASDFGSDDYKALPPEMRRVFVRVVNTHLDGLLPRIKVPTLLFWGKQDTETPMYMAKRLNRKIAGSGLVAVQAGHFAYAEQHNVFCAVLASFLGL